MSDAVYAKSIIEELWDPQVYGRGSVLRLAFEAIARFERSLPKDVRQQRKRQWTERRVRSIIDDEAPCLERYEVADLERMAVKEGRDAYRKSVQRAARLAEFLAHCDEDFYSADIDAQVAMARAFTRPGAAMASAGADEVGGEADRSRELAGGLRDPGTGGGDR